MFSQQQISNIPNREILYNFMIPVMILMVDNTQLFSIKIFDIEYFNKNFSIVSFSGMDDNRIHAISIVMLNQ